MKKIAVPTEEGKVAAHFGRCPEYTLMQTENGEINKTQVIDNPGHKPGFLPRFLDDKGVDCIIAGGMGRRAINIFHDNDIEVVTGAEGEIESCVQAFLNDNLDEAGNICDHDQHHERGGHGCGH
ncbi:NifB/NifX family molybdenum-iron cluster-binding protein [Halarsenatibacter silvermanii]|uniref:Predicted Fe-Mo cluster-binding protein, NifX family n=1 Tax=Halarsenatibacter silvermanii TaxID=321763 RepID=A0A1G9S207_9FIRM|nr:NifB/NifX family molybdenum-iron cluster-binding protein [Halarsenatibacter silvermanii]SDM29452.1 Predicted Fe-Mo cluster-binding protein, NifX family [Halarsenatibacter silvermanii]